MWIKIGINVCQLLLWGTKNSPDAIKMWNTVTNVHMVPLYSVYYVLSHEPCFWPKLIYLGMLLIIELPYMPAIQASPRINNMIRPANCVEMGGNHMKLGS